MLGDAVWIAPEHCLHITLMEIICDTNYGSYSRKQLFSDWYRNYCEIARDVIGKFSSFTLDLDELHVSPSAIIIKASNPDSLNDIRAALLTKIDLPKGTKLPPNIGHCTIARFNKAIDIEKAEDATKPINIHIRETVESFKLVEGLAPPRFSPEIIVAYPLNST